MNVGASDEVHDRESGEDDGPEARDPGGVPQRDEDGAGDDDDGQHRERRGDEASADGLPQLELSPRVRIHVGPGEARETVEFVREIGFQGPLPDPETLRAYEIAKPGTADLILDVFARQAESNRDAVAAAAEFDRAKAEALRAIGHAQAQGVRIGAWVGAGTLAIMAAGIAASAFGAPVSVAAVSALPLVLTGMASLIGAVRERKQLEE